VLGDSGTGFFFGFANTFIGAKLSGFGEPV